MSERDVKWVGVASGGIYGPAWRCANGEFFVWDRELDGFGAFFFFLDWELKKDKKVERIGGKYLFRISSGLLIRIDSVPRGYIMLIKNTAIDNDNNK